MKLGKAASDVKIDIKLSTIKPGRQSDTQWKRNTGKHFNFT
jgi:hypothetical protein